jgi:hypothetical protein
MVQPKSKNSIPVIACVARLLDALAGTAAPRITRWPGPAHGQPHRRGLFQIVLTLKGKRRMNMTNQPRAIAAAGVGD